MSEELIAISGSLVGGGILSGLVTYWIFSSKFEKQRRQFENASIQSQRDLDEQRRKIESERGRLMAEHTQITTDLHDKVEDLTAHLALLQSEAETLERFELEFFKAQTSVELCQHLVDSLSTTIEKHCFSTVVQPQAPYEPIASTIRLTSEDRLMEVLLAAVHQSQDLENCHVQAIKARDIGGLAELRPEVESILVAPVGSSDQRYVFLIACVSAEVPQAKQRALRKVLGSFARTYFRINALEEEVKCGQIDDLTQLPNARALNALLPHLLESATDELHHSCILIECDHLKALNDKYGSIVCDELIKEMVAVIRHSARVEELNRENKRRGMDYLMRYFGAQFMLVLEDTDEAFALKVAERIRLAVEEKRDWYGGVPSWSVSIGISIAPEDDTNARMMVLKSEVALMYVKEKMGGNQLMAFNQVPRQYRVSKLSAKVAGSLGIFDPCSLLQSVASSHKNGILTVEDKTGRTFWAFFEHDKINKAHLDHFRGDYALIEFLSTFEDGQFNFREYSSLSKDTMEEIHRLGEDYTVRKTLERHLVDGARAQDKLAGARRLIVNTRLFVRPTPSAASLIANLPHVKNPPTREELEVMCAITRLVNGRTMLATIMEKLAHYPAYLRWYGSAVLLEQGVIELSKLAMSYSSI